MTPGCVGGCDTKVDSEDSTLFCAVTASGLFDEAGKNG